MILANQPAPRLTLFPVTSARSAISSPPPGGCATCPTRPMPAALGRPETPRVQGCRMPGRAVDPRRCRPYARPPAAPLNSTRAGPAACVSRPTVFILSNTLYNVYYAMFIHVLVASGVNNTRSNAMHYWRAGATQQGRSAVMV